MVRFITVGEIFLQKDKKKGWLARNVSLKPQAKEMLHVYKIQNTWQTDSRQLHSLEQSNQKLHCVKMAESKLHNWKSSDSLYNPRKTKFRSEIRICPWDRESHNAGDIRRAKTYRRTILFSIFSIAGPVWPEDARDLPLIWKDSSCSHMMQSFR